MQGLPSSQRTRRGSTSSNMSGVSSHSSKRRLSSASSRSTVKGRRVGSVKLKVINENQSSKASAVKRVTKKLKSKRVKKVKVSAKLRKQVLQVFDSKLVQGYGRAIIHGGFYKTNGQPRLEIGNTTYNSTQQMVFPLPMTTKQPNLRKGLLFDPYILMYVASRLWSGRWAYSLDPADNFAKGDISSIVKQQGGNPAQPNQAWNNLVNLEQFVDNNLLPECKFKVTECKAKITMRNNGHRPVYITMYVCKPKYQRHLESTTGFGLPIADWEDGLALDAITHATTGADFSGNELSRNRAGANTGANSVTINTMYATPGQTAQWKKLWNFEETKIKLEGGQIHETWVSGETGDVDFAKFFKKVEDTGNVDLFNVQKMNRYVFFTAVNEIAVMDNASTQDYVGRLGNESSIVSAAFRQPSIGFETQMYFGLKMPETVGTSRGNLGNVVLAGNYSDWSKPLTSRVPGYFVDDFYEPGMEVATYNEYYDDNNPAALAT